MNISKKAIHSLASLSLTSLFLAPSASAQQLINLVDTASPYYTLTNLRPGFYVITAVNILLGGAGVLSFLFLLMGGLQWITAGSDKDAVDKSRKKIMQALIGLAIVFSSYALLYVIRTLFNVNLIQFTINNLGS